MRQMECKEVDMKNIHEAQVGVGQPQIESRENLLNTNLAEISKIGKKANASKEFTFDQDEPSIDGTPLLVPQRLNTGSGSERSEPH